jgi:hypothetical protein
LFLLSFSQLALFVQQLALFAQNVEMVVPSHDGNRRYAREDASIEPSVGRLSVGHVHAMF